MPGLFLPRSRPWLWTTAAEGGLKPAPASRFRGAYPHRISSYTLLGLVGLLRSWRTIVGNPHLTLFELPKNILCLATNLVISVQPVIRPEPRNLESFVSALFGEVAVGTIIADRPPGGRRQLPTSGLSDTDSIGFRTNM